MFKAFVLAAVVPVLLVAADVSPEEPAPGNVYNQGSNCAIAWGIDTSGQWSTMNIELMTGSNSDMVHLTTVATLDGTKESSFSYDCPSVTPNSAIYFYQFSTPAAPANLTWTGRFAIADASGNTVDPSQEADGIKFGTGALSDPGSASPAPSYLTGAVVATTAAGNSSAGPAPAPTTVQTVISTSATGALTATGSLTTSARNTATPSSAANQSNGSGSTSGSATSSSTSSSNGASALTLDFKARSLQALAGLIGTTLVFGTML